MMIIRTMNILIMIPIILHTFPVVAKLIPGSPECTISFLAFEANIIPNIPNMIPIKGMRRDRIPRINEASALLLVRLISDSFFTFLPLLMYTMLNCK